MKLSTVALAAAAAGAIGLGALTVPAVAGSDPTLPEVSAEELVTSVLTARAPAFGGTVEVDNALGLPALPGIAERSGLSEAMSVLTQPVTTFRVWSDGHGHGRLALPATNREQVLVEDGNTLWHYNSFSRTATALDHGARKAPEHASVMDPAEVAVMLVDAVRESSTVAVDGTGEVAGRPAYDLVLAPKPTERTLLREVRVAIDAAERMPLQLTVLADGSPDPALRIGFTDLTVGPQDPALFRFTPPEGVTVRHPQHLDGPPGHHPDSNGPAPGAGPGVGPGARPMGRIEGAGWDTVVLGQLPPAPAGPAPSSAERGSTGMENDPLELVKRVGRPVSGPWGNGWVVQTATGTLLVTADRRIAAGAVPQQVLTEALAR